MLDYSLYLVTDRGLSRGRSTPDIVRAAVTLPLVGIGGIHPENAADIIRAGATGVAVVSAIVSAPCPRSAATTHKQQIQSARNKEHAWTNIKNTVGC